MDIQKIISDVLKKLSSDKTLKDKFLSNPVKMIEELTGIDLPDDQIDAVINGIKAKLDVDDVVDKAKGVMGALGGLFGKK